MTTLDLINHVAEYTGLGSRGKIKASIKSLITDWLNIHYQNIYDVYSWPSIKIINFSTTTSDGVVTLPNYIDTIQAVRVDNTPLPAKSELHNWQFNSSNFDDVGTVRGYMPIPDRPLFVDAAAAGVLKFVSSSATDATASTLTVRIEGEVSGVPTSEENDLNGTTQVTTSTSYDAASIIQITKPLTTGRITIYAADGTTELGTAGADDYSFRYRRIQLSALVDTSTTVKFLCSRRFERLRSDNDAIIIPSAELAILSLAKAEAFDYLNKSTMAETERRKASGQLEVALVHDNDVNTTEQTVLPAQGFFNFDQPLKSGLDISATGILS